MKKRLFAPFPYPLPKVSNLLLLYFIIGMASINIGMAQSSEKGINNHINILTAVSSGDLINDNFYLVKIKSSRVELIKGTNLEVVKWISDNSLIMYYDSGNTESIKSMPEIRSIHTIDNSWKRSKNIKDDVDYLQGDYWLKVLDKQKWLKFLNQESRISTIQDYDDYVKVNIKNLPLGDLLKRTAITYIEKAASSPKSEARVIDLNLHPNRINTIHAYFPKLKGTGELVSIKEPFYDISDIDLSGRYVQTEMESEFSDMHALEMATIIAGNGNSFLTGLGVAPKAFHTSSSNAEIVPNTTEYFTSNNIRVQNHSYGTEIESFYGVAAALYDKQAFENPEILHVFSVGNSGLESSDHGRYQGLSGYSNITGNFKHAKNVLTVGAVDTSMNTIQLNSNGPAFDGRIKPELVAYSMTGTSNSAALVSGVTLLLQQAFQNNYSGHLTSSLTKALLINSADEIAEPGPGHKTGYGSLNAYEALMQLQDGQFITDTIVTEIEKKYTIAVPENAKNFKTTLVWTDPSAQPNDVRALINDLNLTVKDKNRTTYFPWILSAEASINALDAPATKGIDHLNNIEQVHIDRIDTDSVEITISAENPMIASQPFSVVFGWELENEFSWTSPTFKDNIPYNGETISHIRWESSYSDQKAGDLYFKLVTDSNWKLVKEEVRLHDENFRWSPEIVNDLAQLKMQIGEKAYLSDTFSISEPLRLNVGFNCSDSLSFYWESISDVDFYALFNLEGNEISKLVNIADTSITVNKSDLGSSFLKIQAYKNGKPLIEGGIIDYNLQGAKCFLESYFVESVQGEGIYHNLQLSSLSGIEKISIEKRNKIGDTWEKLSEFDANSFDLEYLEIEPNNGFNLSRAVIQFLNGVSVVSEIQSAYYVNSSDFIVYPIPLRRNDDLKIFAKERKPAAKIFFYNVQGQELFSISIPNDRNFLDLDSLSPGIYFYKIFDGELQLANGKILIQD